MFFITLALVLASLAPHLQLIFPTHLKQNKIHSYSHSFRRVFKNSLIKIDLNSHQKMSDNFDNLADCESGGKASTNTGNGFYGAFQFDLTTWHSLGRVGLPSDYSYASQKQAAKRLEYERGWSPWPACSRKLGLIGNSGQ